jgi:hypothetical protein
MPEVYNSRQLKYLLGILIILNIADGILTHFLIKLDLGKEANPFLLDLVGEPGFLVLKVAGIFLCALILWDIYRRHPRLAFMSTSVFVTVYIGIVAWNSAIFLI